MDFHYNKALRTSIELKPRKRAASSLLDLGFCTLPCVCAGPCHPPHACTVYISLGVDFFISQTLGRQPAASVFFCKICEPIAEQAPKHGSAKTRHNVIPGGGDGAPGCPAFCIGTERDTGANHVQRNFAPATHAVEVGRTVMQQRAFIVETRSIDVHRRRMGMGA